MRRGCAIAVTASYLAASLPALAGSPPESAPAVDRATLIKARQQFQQALALETGGDWAGASGLFQQVAQVRLTPQVRFHIALCEEHLGKLAAALGHYQIAADEAQEAHATEVAAQVASRTEGLKARIPKVQLQRGAGAEYASISLDGVVLGASSIGSELPVDPGPHTIDATSQGFKPFSTRFQIAEKENKKVEVVLEAAPPPPVEARGISTSGEAPPLPPPTKNLAPFILGGVGVASLAASGVFFLLRSKSIKSLEGTCPTMTSCPATQKSTYDQGKMYTVVADVTLGIGIAGVAAGTTLFLLNRRSAPPTAGSVQLLPVWDSGAGAALVGGF